MEYEQTPNLQAAKSLGGWKIKIVVTGRFWWRLGWLCCLFYLQTTSQKNMEGTRPITGQKINPCFGRIPKLTSFRRRTRDFLSGGQWWPGSNPGGIWWAKIWLRIPFFSTMHIPYWLGQSPRYAVDIYVWPHIPPSPPLTREGPPGPQFPAMHVWLLKPLDQEE